MILLTGGTGFLGSSIARRLIDDGQDVSILKRAASDPKRIAGLLPRVRTFDIDKEPLDSIFAKVNPDVIVHCATDYGRDGAPTSSVEQANLTFPIELLELAVSSKTPVFINTDTILGESVSAYAASKRRFAEALEAVSAQIIAVNVALEHFYGPGGGDVNFVSRMMRELVAGVPRIALTPGEQRRDFIYIDDVVDVFMILIQRGSQLSRGFHSYQVGTGRSVSIRELMSLLVELSGNSRTLLDFGAVAYRPNEAMETHVDTRGITALGWTPKTTLREGLSKVLEAARAQPRG